MATSQSGTLPVTNLQYQQPEKKWRALNTTPRVYVRLQGAGRACSGLAVIAHNGTAEAKLRIMGGLTQDTVNGVNAPYYDSGLVSMWPVSGPPVDALGYAYLSSLITWTNTQALPWWSISFSDPTNLSPFEAGRVMLDAAIRPMAALSGGIALNVVTKGEQRRGDFNRLRTEVRGPNSRRMLLPWTAVNKDTFRRDFFDFQMAHGIVKDFFFSADPDSDQDLQMYSMQALFENLTEFSRLLQYDTSGGIWKGDMVITEQL